MRIFFSNACKKHRLWPSWLRYRVVIMYVITNISEEPAASIFYLHLSPLWKPQSHTCKHMLYPRKRRSRFIITQTSKMNILSSLMCSVLEINLAVNSMIKSSSWLWTSLLWTRPFHSVVHFVWLWYVCGALRVLFRPVLSSKRCSRVIGWPPSLSHGSRWSNPIVHYYGVFSCHGTNEVVRLYFSRQFRLQFTLKTVA